MCYRFPLLIRWRDTITRIMKIKKIETNFTQVSNNPLNDNRLSWKAKGVFAYLYSKPDDWDFSSDRIKNDSSDGRDSLLAGLKELELTGYLHRIKNPTGKVSYILDYDPKSEKPIQGPEPKSDIPTMGKSHSGKSRPISNTEVHSNTELDSNTENAFALFWSSYPKKELKKKAEDKWKAKKLDSKLSEILAFVEEAKKTDRWKKGFIKAPPVFLGNECWNDDLAGYNDKYNSRAKSIAVIN